MVVDESEEPDTHLQPTKRMEVEDVVIHPLVLLSAADHYHRVARNTRKRVVGVLLGQVSKGKVDVTNSYAVPFEENHNNPVRVAVAAIVAGIVLLARGPKFRCTVRGNVKSLSHRIVVLLMCHRPFFIWTITFSRTC
jgi:JAB1/Mov34/MPN/PAD-1 ubiquitin protease